MIQVTRNYLLLLLAGVAIWSTASTAAMAQVTPQQRKVELELRTAVKKAGNLFAQGKFDESADVVIEVQKKFDDAL
ncbi:MAG: hypothetical protein HOA14_12390, partial [Planctomycetaceae bacterium]|nr:hypothetical protein [Planctomycetaceae bacterium]